MFTLRQKQINYYHPNKKPSERLKPFTKPKYKPKKNYLQQPPNQDLVRKYARKLLSRHRTNKLFKVVTQAIKMNKYRKSVIAELLQTEENYVKDLGIILSIIIPHLSNIIPQATLTTIFSNIASITKLNNNFLQELRSKFQTYHPYSLLGKTLICYIPFFKIYFQYYNDFDKSRKTVDFLIKNNKEQFIYSNFYFRFATYVSKMSNSPLFHHLDLESFLVKPVQRLPKYVLLIKDLLKHTFQDHPDFMHLQQAYEQLNAVTEENNQKLNLVFNQAKLFELQRMFGNQLQLLDSKRKYYEERLMTLFWRNTGKSTIVHFLSDLMLVTERKDGEYSLISWLQLNGESQIKDVGDTQYFSNLFTVVAENETLTFIGENAKDKRENMEYIQKIMENLREIWQIREMALSRNRRSEGPKKSHAVAVQVLGTEQRSSSMFTKYTVYIVDISIEDITQKVYLRYSECLELQEFIKREYPTVIQFSYMSDGNWKNKNERKEVEARCFQISNFLQSILNNQQVRGSPEKVLQMTKLPDNFYQLPELLQQEKQQERFNPRLVRTPDKHQKKYSASHLIRSSHSTKQNNDKKSQEDFKILVHTFHPRRYEFELAISSDKRVLDLFEVVAARMQVSNLMDFKLVTMENSKTRKFKILEDDELLSNIFASNTLFSKLIKDKNEIYLRKVVYLHYEQEQLSLKDDAMKATIVCNQLVNDIYHNQYDLECSKLCQLCSFYLHFEKINIRDFEAVTERIQNLIPPQLFKSLRRETWFNKVKERYLVFGETIEKLQKQERFQDTHLIARLTFLSTLSKNQMYGQSLFQCSYNEVSIHLSVNVDGFSIVNASKSEVLRSIGLGELVSLKVYPGVVVMQISDGEEVKVECAAGYQVQRLFELYQEILDQY